MLAMTDTPIELFLPFFANTGVPVAFLVPTPTGFGKSIMDAIEPVRRLFLESGVHDYEVQKQGPANKAMVPAHFVYPDRVKDTMASLYRPVTKQGDPRLWFYRLREYCEPKNLLALFISQQTATGQKEIFVINLSRPDIQASLRDRGFVYELLLESVRHEHEPAERLLSLIREIHAQGFLPSVTPGDPGVGSTLEHALGIDPNCSKEPDFNGIELKAKRISRNGAKVAKTRSTLFTQVPDEGLAYRGIVEKYGKMQTPKGREVPRLQLYETFRASRANGYGLQLDVDELKDKLVIVFPEEGKRTYVAAWLMATLRSRLMEKHHETFWVEASSKKVDGREYFRYDRVTHTRRPNASLLPALLEKDIITVDLAAHIDPHTGKYRDHGVLFKIFPKDLPLLLGEQRVYDLEADAPTPPGEIPPQNPILIPGLFG